MLYDTHESSTAASALSNYLRSLTDGALVAGVCIDACQYYLSSTRNVLKTMYGINLQGNGRKGNPWYRGAFAFVGRKNMPGESKFVQAERYKGPVSLTYIL